MYVSRSPITNFAPKWLATDSSNKLMSPTNGPFKMVEISPIAVTVDKDGISNTVLSDRTKLAPTTNKIQGRTGRCQQGPRRRITDWNSARERTYDICNVTKRNLWHNRTSCHATERTKGFCNETALNFRQHGTKRRSRNAKIAMWKQATMIKKNKHETRQSASQQHAAGPQALWHYATCMEGLR